MSKHKPHSPSRITDPPGLEDRLHSEYAHELTGFDLSEAQQKELLVTLWQIMQGFVDLGFNVKSGDKLFKDAAYGFDDVLNSFHPEDTAHETLAPLSNSQKEEQP